MNEHELEHQKQTQNTDLDYTVDEEMTASGLLPQKQELHKKFIQTLQKILPHLGKDESKIISALIILALKLEGIVGKELSEKDSKMIEILKNCIVEDDDKRDSALKLAERLTKHT
jgi:hypothetical protein